MIVLDASILIAHLDAADAMHDRADALLDACAGEPWAMSVLTLAEVLVGPARTARLTQVLDVIEALDIEAVAIGAEAAPRLAELRASRGVKLPDCCVLLAAETRAAALATFDGRLAGAARAGGVRVVEAPPSV